jgi:hypothetical protein
MGVIERFIEFKSLKAFLVHFCVLRGAIFDNIILEFQAIIESTLKTSFEVR